MTKAFWRDFEIEVADSVYDPSEDSFLLAEHLPDCFGKTFLDMGCGSGIQSLAALSKGASQVTLVDHNEEALTVAKKNVERYFPHARVKTQSSDLFTRVTGTYDVIAFNPPYVPGALEADIRLTGGVKGREVLDRFLKGMGKHMSKDGVVVFLDSSLNEEKETEKELAKNEWQGKVVASRRIFFEELHVWHARRV